MSGELPIEVKAKKRKKRVMTEEQKAAAAERLAKARAVRAANSDGVYKNTHHTVAALSDEDPLSIKSVKAWIKHTREKISAERHNVRAGVKGAEARVASMEGYVRNLNAYLANGDYIDDFYGAEQEHRVNHVCIAPSYNSHGEMNRTVGTWYQDILEVWTREMDAEWKRTRGY